jgi:cytochrome c oxidase assembly protein subunit 15
LAGLVAALARGDALGALAVEASARGAGLRLLRAAWWTAGLAYLQLVLGAVVRHVPLTAPAGMFRTFLLLHLLLAGGLLVQAGLTAWRAAASAQAARGALGGLRLSGLALVLLLAVQIGLGVARYVCKYSWPGWLTDFAFAAGHVVEERSLTQALVTTAHVANGSLILFVAVYLASRASRFFHARVARPWKLRAVNKRTFDLAACGASRVAVKLEPSPLPSEP